ncbi:MAG TPA: hypothetical protein DEB06_02890, partial [Phycisphaerales bacterium]|nr:hypothetical protein [Phycisphaerales bacterium]
MTMPRSPTTTAALPDDLPVPAIGVGGDWRVLWLNGLAGARLGVRPDQAPGCLLGSLLERGEGAVQELAALLAERPRAVSSGVRLGSDGRAGVVDIVLARASSGGAGGAVR